MARKKIKVKEGKKKLIPWLGRFSPEVEKKETFYQKRLIRGPLKFKPSGYRGEDPQERKKLAYEDAKQHADFYRDLIREGVYPKGTKVKVKKERNSDTYTLEFWMPKITSDAKRIRNLPINQTSEIIDKIKETAKKYGYEGRFDEDIHYFRNYGIDNEGQLRYIDTDILMQGFPFKGRHNIYDRIDIRRKQRKRLENKVLTSIIASSFVLSLFFLSPNITGNAIGNSDASSTNLLGIALFIIFILFGFLKIKKP